MRTEKEISEGATVQKKMTVERIKEIRKLLEPEHVYLAERTIDIKLNDVVNLVDTALALAEENERLSAETAKARDDHRKALSVNTCYRTMVLPLQAENARLSRYERAWKQINELATPDEVVLLFLAYSLDKIEKECGIEEDK